MRPISLLVPFLLLPLWACSTTQSMFSRTKIDCPRANVLSDAAQVTKFRGGMGAADAAVSAEMSPASVQCTYDADDQMAEVDLSFPLTVREGVAKGTQADIGYFVAVMDAGNNVLSRKSYLKNYSLMGKASVAYTEEVDNIAISVAKGKMPADYHVLVGFDLTPAELAYNRAARSRVP